MARTNYFSLFLFNFSSQYVEVEGLLVKDNYIEEYFSADFGDNFGRQMDFHIQNIAFLLFQTFHVGYEYLKS